MLCTENVADNVSLSVENKSTFYYLLSSLKIKIGNWNIALQQNGTRCKQGAMCDIKVQGAS